MKHPKLFVSALAAACMLTAGSAKAYPPDVVTAIHAALDDEYKAHTAYAAYLKHFGEIRPFSNIIHSEASHIEALQSLLTDAGEDVPANTRDIEDIEIPASIAEACRNGVDAEVANAALYYDSLLPAVKGHGEVVRVFNNLATASKRRHLPAFKRCASRGRGRR